MTKKISKFLKLIFITLLINISQVMAATNTWEFDLSTDYTLSNSTSFNFTTSLLELNQNTLNHIWVINNATTYNWAYDVVVDWNYAYMTNYLWDRVTILDISNPATPTFVSQLINNNWTIRLDWAAGIVKDWNYLYVASQVSDALQIIDVINPSAPIAAWQLINATTLNWARWIAKSWNYVYIACDTYDALQVINVTNVAAPVITWTYRNAANWNLNWARDIKVVWNYAYVSNYDRDSLAIMNISNPAAPTLTSQLQDATNLNWAHQVEISWNYAYVSAYLNNSVRVINISNPALPTAVTNISWWSYSLTNPRDLLIDWNKLFITSFWLDAVNVADISNPAAPVYITKIIHNIANPLLDWVDGIFKVGNYIYTAVYNSDALEILKFNYDMTSPFIIPNTGFNIWSDYLTSLSNVLWWWNAWSITYQISKDNWTSWYYWNWSTWVTTVLWVANSNSLSVINTNIDDFNLIAWTWVFKFKAFLTSNGDQAVELDSFTINTIPPPSPAWVTTNLALWLKSNKWLDNYVDWWSITNWLDYSWNWLNATTWVASPTIINNTSSNLNFYPLVNFNWTQSLQNLANWWFSDSYFIVIVPNQTVDWTLSWQVPFGFDCNSWVLSSGTCWLPFSGITLWAFTVAINDEVITHAIGSSTNWRSSQIWANSYELWKPMLLSSNENLAWNWTDIYEKWNQKNNFNINTYQTLSTANFSLGRSLDPANPFPYNWKIAEVINFSNRVSDFDRQKIESYLAFKYGITLNSWNQNYLNSAWTVIWDYTLSWDYNHNIFWLWRDDNTDLSNVISKSSNNWFLSISAIWEWTNISPSFIDITDLEYLFVADNNLSNTWIQIWAPLWYDILSRKWKIKEIWDIWTTNFDFDVDNSSFNIPSLNAGTNYYFVYDTDIDWLLSDETPISMTNIWWSSWRVSWLNISNNSIFTIATESSGNNIPTDISLSNNSLNENVVSWTSIWLFSTIDADLIDSHTYSLVSWIWSSDNSFFSIVWNSLSLNISPDYEIKNLYSIRVQTDDWNWWQFQEQFDIFINNIWESNNTIIDFELDTPWKYNITSWNWFRWTSSSFEWTYSFESNNLWAVNSQSCFEVNNTFYGWIWTIDFKYRVSSQAWADFFRFYIDNVEQQSWSWEVAWSTYAKTDVTSWSHIYKWCYTKDWATNTWSDKIWIDYITFSYTSPDLDPPVISLTNFSSWVLLPWWNHNIEIDYNDIWSGIDTSLISLEFYKWNWAWWPNIFSSWINPWYTITSSNSTYSTNNLLYGKYKYVFIVYDNYWNSTQIENIFFIDKPEFTISTDIHNSSIWPTYWPDEIVITVKTVGAPYQLELYKNSNLSDWNGNVIIDWDWTYWVWYDINPYSWPRKNITSNPIIWNWILDININWEYNIYTHRIKVWTIIDEEKAAWDYEMNISFRTIFSY